MDRILKYTILIVVIFTGISCSNSEIDSNNNENLINKVNNVQDQWINYNGVSEKQKSMIKTQFIPYSSSYDYRISHDAYISYFYGDEFIKTVLYEDTPETIRRVNKADGIILSFNKNNKNGIKLTKTN